MEFADGRCCECGAEFGDAKPKRVTKLKEPYTTPFGRYVEFVGPCPSCGKNIPLSYAGIESEPEVEPEAEAPETEAEVEPETEEPVAEPEAEAPETEPSETETPGEEKGGG